MSRQPADSGCLSRSARARPAKLMIAKCSNKEGLRARVPVLVSCSSPESWLASFSLPHYFPLPPFPFLSPHPSFQNPSYGPTWLPAPLCVVDGNGGMTNGCKNQFEHILNFNQSDYKWPTVPAVALQPQGHPHPLFQAGPLPSPRLPLTSCAELRPAHW